MYLSFNSILFIPISHNSAEAGNVDFRGLKIIILSIENGFRGRKYYDKD